MKLKLFLQQAHVVLEASLVLLLLLPSAERVDVLLLRHQELRAMLLLLSAQHGELHLLGCTHSRQHGRFRGSAWPDGNGGVFDRVHFCLKSFGYRHITQKGFIFFSKTITICQS